MTVVPGQMRRLIGCVCRRLGIQDPPTAAATRIQFIVKGPMPADAAFPTFQASTRHIPTADMDS